MTAHTATALLSVTASPVRTVIATTSLVVSSSTVVTPKSLQLLYVGSTPTLANALVTKKFADDFFRINSFVDQNYVYDQSDTYRTNLLLQSEVLEDINETFKSSDGQQDYRKYPRIVDLTNGQKTGLADGYVDNSLLGNASSGTSGVAKATTQGNISFDNVHPLVKTDNKAIFINCLTQASSVVKFTATEKQTSDNSFYDGSIAASVTIEDPGFAYYPMNFVYIQGKSGGDPSVVLRTEGTGNRGMITVAAEPTNNQPPTTIFAQGICMPTPYKNWHLALPRADTYWGEPPVVPSARHTALRGKLKLNLYLTNYQGTNYTFYSGGMVWFLFLLPTNTKTLS